MSADAEKGERMGLLPKSGERRSWPIIQPNPGYMNSLHCMPCIFCYPFLAVIFFVISLIALVLFCAGSILAGLLCFLPMSCFGAYTYCWSCMPNYWDTDIYTKMIYLSHMILHWGVPVPEANEKFMDPKTLKPKGPLPKVYVDYALNIQVPLGDSDQFLKPYIMPRWHHNFIEHHLVWAFLFTDRFSNFEEDEDCVAYVMKQMQAIYPPIYQEWTDKHSDQALARFCLQGMGAHRVEVDYVGGQKMYVLRTNALSGLEVRDGFERYGGDVYFDECWKPVMIIDQGLGPFTSGQAQAEVVTKPGDPDWERAKFRFRSSMFALVTLVDHLFHIHLQTGNIFVTAMREQLSADHPIRRFLTPFTYQTISINDNAKYNLVAPRSMGPRCFGFTNKSLELAFGAAPDLVMPKAKDVFDMGAYIRGMKSSGLDTEYWRQALELFEIYERFVGNYLSCYYASKEELVADPELRSFAKQFFHSLEKVDAASMGRIRKPYFEVVPRSATASAAWDFYVKWIAGTMWLVTAGHEQMGAVEVYAQDASWTAFKWTPGARVGTRQTATAQALLMSFTSTPMPKLLGGDWLHLFPPTELGDGENQNVMNMCTSPKNGMTADGTFYKFQSELQKMADKCDQYNASASSRAFPDCYPVYTNNPRILECSISV